MDTALFQHNGALPAPRTHEEELALIRESREEAERRDSKLTNDKWHWKLFAFFLGGLLVPVIGWGSWGWLRPMAIHAPVQLIQVTDEKQITLIGPPQELYAYTPAEGRWMQMVGEWVQKRRWQGIDPKKARAEIEWLEMYTCKPALDALQRWVKEEKPIENIGRRKAEIEVRSVTKTAAPETYTVLWTEWVTEQHLPPKPQEWSGTFTVGRIKLRNPAMILANRDALCVTSYGWNPTS